MVALEAAVVVVSDMGVFKVAGSCAHIGTPHVHARWSLFVCHASIASPSARLTTYRPPHPLGSASPAATLLCGSVTSSRALHAAKPPPRRCFALAALPHLVTSTEA